MKRFFKESMMTKKYKEILGRVIVGLLVGAFLLFFILDPDDEHDPPETEKEKITTVISE